MNNIPKITKKHKVTLMGMLALVVGLAVGNNILNNQETMITSSDYKEYEEEEMLEHDGDVLVDSLNITTSDDTSELASAEVYMSEVRSTLQEDRNQILSMLTSAAAEAENTAEQENANKEKLQLIEYMEQEKNIESIIGSKDLPPCLVIITENAVNVTVQKEALTQSEIAQICDIIIRETDRNASEIIIQSGR